jgi:hypothetical protein
MASLTAGNPEKYSYLATCRHSQVRIWYSAPIWGGIPLDNPLKSRMLGHQNGRVYIQPSKGVLICRLIASSVAPRGRCATLRRSPSRTGGQLPRVPAQSATLTCTGSARGARSPPNPSRSGLAKLSPPRQAADLAPLVERPNRPLRNRAATVPGQPTLAWLFFKDEPSHFLL